VATEAARPAAEQDAAAEDMSVFNVLASPAGVVAGAVLAAARNSAALTGEDLAGQLGVSGQTVADWESGAQPQCGVRPDQVARLTGVLLKAGADPRIVADLSLASECDLLVFGLVHGLDDFLAEVPPVDEDEAGTAARDLLRWALAGIVPARYGRHAALVAAGPLLDLATRTRFEVAAHALAWHLNPDARAIGRALVALA